MPIGGQCSAPIDSAMHNAVWAVIDPYGIDHRLRRRIDHRHGVIGYVGHKHEGSVGGHRNATGVRVSIGAEH